MSGDFCPAPRARRELRVAIVSILAGMAIGAAIMAIHVGQAAETDAVSGNAQLKSPAPDPLAAVPAASARIKDADKAKAVEAIEPYPMRMVRVRSSKPASPLAGIPLGRAARATSLRRSGLARERRGLGVASGFTASAIISSNRRARRLWDQEAAKRHARQTPAGRRE
jgi:hypothetical protein